MNSPETPKSPVVYSVKRELIWGQMLSSVQSPEYTTATPSTIPSSSPELGIPSAPSLSYNEKSMSVSESSKTSFIYARGSSTASARDFEDPYHPYTVPVRENKSYEISS